MKFLGFGKITFILFFLLYLATGYYIAYVLEIYHNDAIARTALASFTIFGRDPHLASIGFVWQPFPSLIQVPLLIALKPFGYMMMAGPIISSVAGALSVMIIYGISVRIFNNNKFLSILIAIFFGFNPMILLYSAIGSSEIMFIATILSASYFLIKWYKDQRQIDLLLSSFFVSFSFWSRYESVAVFFGIALLLLIGIFVFRFKKSKAEAIMIQYSAPFLFSLFLWILANWMIMKDPLYFMNSPYSNKAFTAVLKDNPQLLEYSYNSITGSFFYALKRVTALSPVILTLPLFLVSAILFFKKKIDKILLIAFLTGPYIAILLFHIYQLYKGESLGWLRFYIYAIPAGSLLTIFVINTKRTVATIIVFVLLLFGMYTTARSMNNSIFGKEEISFSTKFIDTSAVLDFSRTYSDQKEVSKFMDKTQGNILLDTNDGFAIHLFAENPERYIITSDIDYEEIIKNYSSHVDWIILPDPSVGNTEANKIYKNYPQIWEGKAPNVKLHKEIDGWRIFKVGENINLENKTASPSAN